MTAQPSGERLTFTQREAMQRGMGGGWPGYLERLREGHRPTFARGREVDVVYSGCTCGHGLCPVPHLLAHIDDCIRAYEMKAEEFARETARAANICLGCGRPYRPEQHVYGQSKCCPDCSHRVPDLGSNEARP